MDRRAASVAAVSTAPDTAPVSSVLVMAEPSPITLGEAIARALDGRLSQAELARKMEIAQPNVNRWVKNVYAPSHDDIARIEDLCERPRGFILIAAGYVECPANVTVAEAIERDPDLDDSGRAIVTAAYESARSYYRASRQTEEIAGD